MSPFISDADLARTDLGQRVRSTTTIADLFGDALDRALHREAVYAVPLDQRTTCPIHLDWVTGCAELHLHYPAAA
ncbi:hypothetical protein ACF07S_10215 [Streptomyces sp. NPDC016640]|uniref:hypothetical protein n=1 Tax=Streptomyces sp. NPDC016640 TaxID=3364969 RepID=UPI003700D4A5